MSSLLTVAGFPVYNVSSNQGLVKLTKDSDKLHYQQMIEDFKTQIRNPNQPSFFISWESWRRLANGVHTNVGGVESTWINQAEYAAYEVYAFTFCFAFKRETEIQSVPQLPQAYFRVRTILKSKTTRTGTPTIPVFVETDNIAYVSLEIAYQNQSNPLLLPKDCLIFIDKDDFAAHRNQKLIKELIDDEVYVMPSSVKPGKNPYNYEIPVGFTNPKHHCDENGIIENEGGIFGKQKIWDKLLNGKYRLDKKNKDRKLGTLVSFVWNKATNHISYDIKINDEYVTVKDCPQPSTCSK